MQDNVAAPDCGNNLVAEVFHLTIKPEEVGHLADKGRLVHQTFSQLSGYDGMDVIFLTGMKVMILLRWRTQSSFEEHLPRMLLSCSLKEWLASASPSSHEPAILQSFTLSTKK